ncbi:hypothetical protein [Hyalangium sp.]|uniref:hypothetical protein n=1 Tax=Hyalangium sp. TaxID=2028555 RepID=UPI002D5611D0|nr:hypothetical protein [Hyalangium sp.]HYH96029.1 hypothetical protein [Hyalangium sp.]
MCAHWRRCKALIQDLDARNTRCDFSPSRFSPAQERRGRLRPHMLYVRTRLRTRTWWWTMARVLP